MIPCSPTVQWSWKIVLLLIMKALEQLRARNWVIDRNSSARKRGKGYTKR